MTTNENLMIWLSLRFGFIGGMYLFGVLMKDPDPLIQVAIYLVVMLVIDSTRYYREKKS